MIDGPAKSSGHRLVSHVADVILEAWATTRVSCLEEAARGLIGSFVDVENVVPTGRVPVALSAAGDEEMLVSLLEEVIYIVEALGQVSVRVHLDEHEDRSVRGSFETIPATRVQSTGAPPKGMSRSDLVFEERGQLWRCHVLVDVWATETRVSRAFLAGTVVRPLAGVTRRGSLRG